MRRATDPEAKGSPRGFPRVKSRYSKCAFLERPRWLPRVSGSCAVGVGTTEAENGKSDPVSPKEGEYG